MSIEDDIIQAIKSGKIKQRPRAYFLLRRTVSVIAWVIALLVLVYLVAFVIFALRESGIWFEPSFGFAGWFAFLGSLPWVLISLLAVFFVLLAILARKYEFGYRWPILYSLLGVIFLVATANLLIAQTSLYSRIFNGGVNEKLPLVGGYYRDFEVPSANDIHRGQVVEALPGGFIMRDLYGDTSSVLIASDTVLPSSMRFEIGDAVVVFGDRSPSGTIDAIGVREVGP